MGSPTRKVLLLGIPQKLDEQEGLLDLSPLSHRRSPRGLRRDGALRAKDGAFTTVEVPASFLLPAARGTRHGTFSSDLAVLAAAHPARRAIAAFPLRRCPRRAGHRYDTYLSLHSPASPPSTGEAGSTSSPAFAAPRRRPTVSCSSTPGILKSVYAYLPEGGSSDCVIVCCDVEYGTDEHGTKIILTVATHDFTTAPSRKQFIRK